jgi:hypothetical protein
MVDGAMGIAAESFKAQFSRSPFPPLSVHNLSAPAPRPGDPGKTGSATGPCVGKPEVRLLLLLLLLLGLLLLEAMMGMSVRRLCDFFETSDVERRKP